MHVLTCQSDDAIRIGDDVTLTVFKVAGSSVRIGIDAPRDVRVDRSEVSARRLEDAQARTTGTSPDATTE